MNPKPKLALGSAPALSATERRAAGKALRNQTPRSSHALWSPASSAARARTMAVVTASIFCGDIFSAAAIERGVG